MTDERIYVTKEDLKEIIAEAIKADREQREQTPEAIRERNAKKKKEIMEISDLHERQRAIKENIDLFRTR